MPHRLELHPLLEDPQNQDAQVETAKLYKTLSELFTRSDVLTLEANDEKTMAVILENKTTNQQILVELRWRGESSEVLPRRLFIRMLDQETRTCTRVIFNHGHSGVSNDFDIDTDLNESIMADMSSVKALEYDPHTPAWYDPAFLSQVNTALQGAQVQSELHQQILQSVANL